MIKLDIKKREKKVDIHFYIPETTVERLDKLCKANGVSRGEVLTYLLNQVYSDAQ